MTEVMSKDVALRLRAIGLQPTVVQTLLSEVEHLLTTTGPEWTCGRLKEYKVDFVRHLAGLPPVGTYKKRNVNLNGKLYRLPKGVFGYLFRLGLEAASKQRKRVLHVVWNALITYTQFKAKPGAVTWNQWKKFSSAVRALPPEEGNLRRAKTYVTLGCRSLPMPPTYVGKPRPLITYQPREGKRRPVGRETVPETQPGILMELTIAHERARWPLSLTLWSEELHEVLRGTSDFHPDSAFKVGTWRRMDMFRRDRSRKRPIPAGVIGLIQEPGYKLRAVANPMRVYQLALEPLGRCLFKWLRSVPEDCCYRQDSGVFAIQEVMTRDDPPRIHSVDLSNATDWFPLSLMMQVFQRMRAPKGALEALLRVARGEWFIPQGSAVAKAESLKWERGLPLGLYPCFALFSLGHHALVRGICVSLGKEDFPYRILGDDLVIWDDDVAREYQSVMDELGCPISRAKSLVARRVAEFAGKTILPWTILHGLKYGEEPNDNSFLELVKFLGPRTIRILKPKQRKVARFVASLPQPWGYGYNPRGLPYAERLRLALAWDLVKSPKVEQKGIAQIRIVNQQMYVSGLDPGRAYALWSSVAPDAIDQIASISTWNVQGYEFFADKAELLRGNALAVLELQRLGSLGEMKGVWKPAELRKLLRITSPQHPDHPFSKPLVQSLLARVDRAERLVHRQTV